MYRSNYTQQNLICLPPNATRSPIRRRGASPPFPHLGKARPSSPSVRVSWCTDVAGALADQKGTLLLAGRARAVSSLTKAGMNLDAALQRAGLT